MFRSRALTAVVWSTTTCTTGAEWLITTFITKRILYYKLHRLKVLQLQTKGNFKVFHLWKSSVTLRFQKVLSDFV